MVRLGLEVSHTRRFKSEDQRTVRRARASHASKLILQSDAWPTANVTYRRLPLTRNRRLSEPAVVRDARSGTEQDLGRQADESVSAAVAAGLIAAEGPWDDVLDQKCRWGQEGVEVCGHERPSIPPQ
jgi:hypothetical protein